MEDCEIKKLGIKCISLYCNTNEHLGKDDTRCFFYFYDYPNRIKYEGAISWNVLFDLLKPYLRTKPEAL